MAKKKKGNLNAQVSDDQLEGVSGGYIFNPSGGCRWEVINNFTGNVLASFSTKEEAKRYARRSILATTGEISWERLKKLRE